MTLRSRIVMSVATAALASGVTLTGPAAHADNPAPTRTVTQTHAATGRTPTTQKAATTPASAGIPNVPAACRSVVGKPYGKYWSGSWHVVGWGTYNCNTYPYAYVHVTLQQKRWWGWDDRSSKNLFKPGTVYPSAKCKTYGWYTWRTEGQYVRNFNGKLSVGKSTFSPPWRTRC